MRFGGVSARSGVRMSFSRRIGVWPSMTSRVRWSALVTMQSPTMMRSPGFSSTFSAMTVSAPFAWTGMIADDGWQNVNANGGPRAAVRGPEKWRVLPAEQAQHVAVALHGKRQGRGRELLTSLQ